MAYEIQESVMQEIDGVYSNNSLDLKFMDYVHPNEVVQDDRLSAMEKRTLLCAWASDACAVESRPGFRWLPGTPGPILVDHVLAGLRKLDDLTGSSGRSGYSVMSNHRRFARSAQLRGTVGTIAG